MNKPFTQNTSFYLTIFQNLSNCLLVYVFTCLLPKPIPLQASAGDH